MIMSLNNYKARALVRHCPWCGCLPEFKLPYRDDEQYSWIWHLACVNHECKMRPFTASINVRGREKDNAMAVAILLEKLCDMWNNRTEELEKDFVEVDIRHIIFRDKNDRNK